MTSLMAEVEWVTKSIVTVDVEKHCAYYAQERADFEGDDIAFVKDSLEHHIGLKELLEPDTDTEAGLYIEGEWDDGEIRFYKPIP